MTEQKTQGNQKKFTETNLFMNPGVLLGKLWRRVMVYYRRWFCHQNYIFQHQGPFPPENRLDCTFKSYKSFEELPEGVKADICADGTITRLETDKLELDENATLWIAFVDSHVVTTVFTRKGKHFHNWFLEIQPEDVVVFRLRTHENYRGRGFAPSLINHAIHKIMKKPRSAFIDCRTYNKASIRCIKKSGFKCVAQKKTITREWALYG